MLGKLMKYEFKSGMRFFAIIWGSLLGMALLAGFLIMWGNKLSATSGAIRSLLEIITVLSTVLYGALIAAVIIATLIIVIQRFYKGVLGDEGYLANTLPVSKHSLLLSKGLTASIIFLISMAAIALSVFLLNVIPHPEGTFLQIRSSIGSDGALSGRGVLLLIEFLILVVLYVLKSVYKIYASLSIGQLVDKHRLLLSIGAYFGINIAASILLIISGTIITKAGITINLVYRWQSTDIDGRTQLAFLAAAIFLAVGAAIYHFVTERLLTKHLNLQ